MFELTVGQLITPSIRLDGVLGRGGMGSLWLAFHLRLKVRVVVKFIASEFAGNPEIMARFEREAAATMAAKSAHVVQILDYGFTEQKVPFIAMEYLDGEDLAAKIAREQRVAPVEFAEILRQACKGLTRAHAQGIIHRDIKPENIFLTYVDGELAVKVLDFGIAKADPAFGFGATRTGVFLGTVYYMSPEQSMGAKSVDHRTDLWSLGVVAYYALTGVRPFEADAIGALVTDITTGAISPPSRHLPALGPAIDHWMSRALARDPSLRFASAKDMAAAFDAAVAQVSGRTARTTGEIPRSTVSGAVEGSPQEDHNPAIEGATAAKGSAPVNKTSESQTSAPLDVRAPSQTVRYSSNVSKGALHPYPTDRAATSTPAAMSASIGTGAGLLDQTVEMPPKSQTPLVIGVGIGIALTLAIAVGIGLGFVRAGHPSPTLNGAAAAPLETRSAPAIGTPQPPSTTPDSPPPPVSSQAGPAASGASSPPPFVPAITRTAPAVTATVNRKAAPRPNPGRNGNPFDGTY